MIAFTLMVYPCSILSYMGQGAYLSKSHSNEQTISLYLSVPPVGSQTIITGTFSIIKQCSALGCFPRVKVIRTSSKVQGQVYIPEVNWILMLLCLAVIIGFRDTTSLSNASGLAVITVMLVTTCELLLKNIEEWQISPDNLRPLFPSQVDAVASVLQAQVGHEVLRMLAVVSTVVSMVMVLSLLLMQIRL